MTLLELCIIRIRKYVKWSPQLSVRESGMLSWTAVTLLEPRDFSDGFHINNL